MINTVCQAVATPIPLAATSPRRFLTGLREALQWGAASLPVWGTLLVMAGTPFLPTMTLAGMLLVVAAFTVLRYRFTLSLSGLGILCFVFVTLLGGLTSFTPSTSIPIALLTSILMLSFFLVTACVQSRKQLECFFFVFTLSAAVAGVVGLYQFIARRVDTTWLDTTLFADISFRMYGPFNNPNVYGTYLLLAIPLCAAMVRYCKRFCYKACALAVSALLLFNLFYTYSRGCYLALALAAFVFVLLYEKRLVVFCSAGLLALPFVMPATILNRLLSITNLSDSSTAYRLSIWQASLRIIKDFWITGLGQGFDAFNTVFPSYAFSQVTASHAHNLFLQVFVALGLVGLLTFLAMLACFFREMAYGYRRASALRDRAVSAMFIAAAVSFLFQGIFDHVFYNYTVMLAFFLFLGMGCVFVRVSQYD